MSSNQSNNTAQMQQAFQQFMLGKKSPKASTPARAPQPSPSSRGDPQRKKLLKECQQSIDVFTSTVKREWLETDDTLLALVQSVAHLRDRLWKESRMLARDISRSEHERNIDRHIHLLREDVDLALSHDLMKHEKALAGLRKLMLALQQAQEALGRRLDTILSLQLELTASLQSSDDEGAQSLLSRMRSCEQVFGVLASELLRKQTYTEELLQTSNDLLIASEGVIKDSSVGVARKISHRWSRTHKESPIRSMGDFMEVLA